MTIGVVWKEGDFLWCAADTRLVAGDENRITTEVAAKIYTIPLSTRAFDPDSSIGENDRVFRQPHFWTQYGFVYSGAASPASQTAIMASTLLQNLAKAGDRGNPPVFEDVAKFVCKLATFFMRERRQFDAEGIFQAALLGWCPYEHIYKVAHINGRDDMGGFRVELSFPGMPNVDGEPWLILGSAKGTFLSSKSEYLKNETNIRAQIPRRVIEKMVSDSLDVAVGGATSIGVVVENSFQLFYSVEPLKHGEPEARRVFNGLDLDAEIGPVGQYLVAINGIA